MRKIVIFNVYAFLFWIVALSFSNFDLAFFRYFESFLALIIILILLGLNLAALIQLFSPKQFSKIEILSIASALALIVPPLLVTLEYSFLNYLSPSFPFINSLAIFILLLITWHKRKNANLENFYFLNLKIEKEGVLKFIKSPLFWVSILYISIIVIIFSAFYALPDLDPFYWIQRYSNELSANAITQLTLDRPLFSSLIYFFNRGAHIDLYASFKYVIPLLSILMLIPAWLVAKKFPSKIVQTLILLLPLSSSSTILYTQIAMPQAILIILTFYFFFFLIYSWLFRKEFFYYFAGFIIFFGYLYHEIAAVIFLVWLLVSIVSEWKKIIQIALKEKLLVFFGVLLLISNASFFAMPFNFIFDWFKKIISVISLLKINFLFPLFYINMNGQSMGWGDSIGVIKYYLYYPGIAILLFLFAFIFMFFRSKEFRTIVNGLRKNKEFIVLTLCFAGFFAISEILPRLFDIALLPERIWIYTGIFSLIFFFIIAKIEAKKIKVISVIASFGIAINIGGAIYINSLKKYMITNDKLSSVEWIKKSLPNNRVIFTSVDKNLLRYYGSSTIQTVPADFYYDINTTLAEINKFKVNKDNLENNYLLFIKTSKNNFEELSNKKLPEHKDSVLELLDENIQKSTALVSLIRMEKTDSEDQSKLYIYYSRMNEKDPYVNRPYYANIIHGQRKLIFDQYPDKFQRIYDDKPNNIIIWQIL